MPLSGYGPGGGAPPKTNRVNEYFRRHGYTLAAIGAVAAVLALLAVASPGKGRKGGLCS